MVTTEDIKILSTFMDENNIPFVLTGTAALMVHGIVPDGYKPDDIDIIVLVSEKDECFKQVEKKLTNLQNLAGETSKSDYNDVITFRANGKKVNAFMNNEKLNSNKYIGHFKEEGSYKSIIVDNYPVNVSNVIDVLKAKFNLRRIKDYMFAKNLASTILNIGF